MTLLVHCVRRASGFVPGMSPENSSEFRAGLDEDEDDVSDVRIDVTNRWEDL